MYLLENLLKKEYFKWNDFTELVVMNYNTNKELQRRSSTGLSL